jgi:hypothetical protein
MLFIEQVVFTHPPVIFPFDLSGSVSSGQIEKQFANEKREKGKRENMKEKENE